MARFLLAAALLPALGTACGAGRSMPEADLGKPGWSVWSGQALWERSGDRPPVAGELVLARNDDGDVVVNFAKPPFSIFTVRTEGRNWWLDFIQAGRTRSGTGRPPRRFIWFYVPDMLFGDPPPRGWTVSREANGAWSITRQETGESIRLVLDG